MRIGNISRVNDPGAHRAESIKALGLDRRPIEIAHEIADRKVVAYRISGHVIHRLIALNAARLAPDHNAQFTLVVHVLDSCRPHHRSQMPHNRRRVLDEGNGLLG